MRFAQMDKDDIPPWRDDAPKAKKTAGAKPNSNNAASGWALPEVGDGWGLDLTGGSADLPAPGDYAAVIEEVRLAERSDVVWMIVRYRLEGFEAEPATDIAPIAARPGSEHFRRRAEGARLLNRLALATRVDLNVVKDPFDLPGLLERKRVTLRLAHRERDGVSELNVRAIMPART
jgi:hypothetical protein